MGNPLDMFLKLHGKHQLTSTQQHTKLISFMETNKENDNKKIKKLHR